MFRAKVATMSQKRANAAARTSRASRVAYVTGSRSYITPYRGPAYRTQVPRYLGVPAGRMTTSGPELKSVDIAPATAALNTTGTVAVLNIPVTGAAFYNRIGNKIQMKSLELRGRFNVSANATGSVSEYLRVLVVYDAQTNGAAPTFSDVITSYTSAGATSSTVIDFLNINNRDRFKVLMDKALAIPYNGGGALNEVAGIIDYTVNPVNIHQYIKLNGLTTNYKASAGAVGDISTGAIFLLTFGNIAAASEGFVFDYSARLRYYDQ